MEDLLISEVARNAATDIRDVSVNNLSHSYRQIMIDENCLKCREETNENLVVIWKDPQRGCFTFPAEEAWIYEPEKAGYLCSACWEEGEYEQKFKNIKPYLILYNEEYKPNSCRRKIFGITDKTPEYMYKNANWCSPEELKDVRDDPRV